MNPENKCADLQVEQISLTNDDSLKIMMNMQTLLQARIGKLQTYRDSNMHEKSKEIIYNAHCIQAEIQELLDRLPWKAWKKYSQVELNGWTSQEQKIESIFEVIDAFHFFLNILIILGISAEDVFAYYKSQNAENFDRQDRGY